MGRFDFLRRVSRVMRKHLIRGMKMGAALSGGASRANPGTGSQFPANCAGNSVPVPGLQSTHWRGIFERVEVVCQARRIGGLIPWGAADEGCGGDLAT